MQPGAQSPGLSSRGEPWALAHDPSHQTLGSPDSCQSTLCPGLQGGERARGKGTWLVESTGPTQEIHADWKESTKASPWVGLRQGLQWPFPSFHPHNHHLERGHTVPILHRGKLRPKVTQPAGSRAGEGVPAGRAPSPSC